MANRFKQAAPRASRLYKSGRYKTFADAMRAALKKTGSKKSKRKVRAAKPRKRRIVKVSAPRVKRSGQSLSGIMSKAKKIINDKIDSNVLRKYHAKGKRVKKKIQKRITALKSQLRKFQ